MPFGTILHSRMWRLYTKKLFAQQATVEEKQPSDVIDDIRIQENDTWVTP